jgi:hypothetical protein
MRSIFDTTVPLRVGAGGEIWYGIRMLRRSMIESRILISLTMLRKGYHPVYVLDHALGYNSFPGGRGEAPCRGERAIIKRILRLTYPELYMLPAIYADEWRGV